MIEEWTPTTEQVRDGYAIDPEAEHHDPIGYPQWERYARRAFDRWLAAHDAELLERVADEIEKDRPEMGDPMGGNSFRLGRDAGLAQAAAIVINRAAQIRKEEGL
jgi:hypothetical protein